jgi:hypothetical protein
MVVAVVLTGWYVGLAIAAVTISIVVVQVALILGLARRIGSQAVAITDSLAESRDNTQPLWAVNDVNRSLRVIISSAGKARTALGGE